MVSVCKFCHANDKASMGITYVLYVANADFKDMCVQLGHHQPLS